MQLVVAIIAGTGMYVFSRRVLTVGFWPATFAAWCYPLTGFFVLWQGAPPSQSVYWLPWILLAVDRTVRHTSRLAPVGLSAMTGLVLISGQLDGAAQVLLVSGCYGAWCWLAEVPQTVASGAGAEGCIDACGWLGAGFLLAAPAILPVLDYAQTGARVGRRVAGSEERPPVGLAALPQVVLPRLYGSSERGCLPLFPKNQSSLNESSAATYTGLLAALFAAPLAFCSRRHRSSNLFWVLLSFFSLSWCLNVPVLVHLLRLPGLNLMSHNRLVFAAAFSILALAAVGLDILWQGRVQWRWWSWVPLALLAGLGGWCGYRAIVLPEPIKTELGLGIAQGRQTKWVHDLEGVRDVQAWFSRSYAVAAVLSGLGAAGWLLLWRRKEPQLRLACLLGPLLVGDLIWFGFGRSAQCDPSLYYPRIPVLEQLAKSAPGRIIGYTCLPALLGISHGLRDIRGYDGVDPARLMDLLAIGGDSRSAAYAYAFAQTLAPKADPTPEGGIRLPPVLDMLNVRYVIFRGSPNPTDRPFLQGPDYFVLLNRSALARAFVPRRVEAVPDEQARLEKLASPGFDPREVAYVESPVSLPSACQGRAEILSEIPTRITVTLQMDTPGLVVLADLWDKGWKAYLNGKPVTVLRANHAIRGVMVPAGSGTLEFRYEPATFAWGLTLASLASLALVIWVAGILWKRRVSSSGRGPFVRRPSPA